MLHSSIVSNNFTVAVTFCSNMYSGFSIPIRTSEADLSTDVRYLKNIIYYLRSGYDIAIGSRYVQGSLVKRKSFRRFTSFLYRFFVKIFFNIQAKDHATGFKGYKREVFFNLIDDIGITNANVRGVSWGTEITIRAERKGYKIKEFPVNWLEGKKSEIKILKEGIKIIKYLFNLRLRLL